ncbi:hypothetical protein G6L16_024680 (plasmid) [Agrobacterium tumefaciens]|uniref:hypothetical protein n=1 Tax=Agrobacterium tumefaciens TaxID=358 RepID=UPI00157286B9|nr:hypothetical protein [Agrobacterium tumefaciens]NSZ66178.1 hypothetical protein [Agrobacterium tumefaciens]NTA72550.1 hypothetical protein [Agrobacterium tumefaciens]WIE41790.1 hypothetical protein G6L16_024680 [Agrobacterium tumefaciens]
MVMSANCVTRVNQLVVFSRRFPTTEKITGIRPTMSGGSEAAGIYDRKRYAEKNADVSEESKEERHETVARKSRSVEIPA